MTDTPSRSNGRRPRMATDPLALRIGERILRLRTARGMSGRSLAAAIGQPNTAVVAWERGRVVPKVESLLKIAKVLECPVAALVPGEGEGRQELIDRVRALPDSAMSDLSILVGILERSHKNDMT